MEWQLELYSGVRGLGSTLNGSWLVVPRLQGMQPFWGFLAFQVWGLEFTYGFLLGTITENVVQGFDWDYITLFPAIELWV